MSSMDGGEPREVKSVFVCSSLGCDKTFSRRSRLLVHLRTHTGEKPFTCDEPGCDKAYARAQHLKRHKDVSHCTAESSTPLQQFLCSISDCEGKSFSSQANLKRHQRTVHNKQYKFRCPVEGCKKKFSNQLQLDRHEHKHRNTNPFVCRVDGCGYSCKSSSHLKRHEKVHEGYKCPEEGCDVKVETWTQLRKHRMVCHPRVYECGECTKTFKKKTQLKRHLVAHTSQHPLFLCDHEGCSRSYLDVRNLKFHVRSYHDKQRLECSYSGCSQTFVNKSKLVQHSKLHDPNKPPPKKMPKKGHRKKSMAERLANIQTHMIEATDSGREDQPLTDIVTNNYHPIKGIPVKDNLPIIDSVVEDCQPIVTAVVEDKQPMVDVVAEQGHPITKFVAKDIQPIQVVENNQPCTDNGLHLIKSVLHSERIDLEMERNGLDLDRNDLELERNNLDMNRNDLELERNDLELAINTNKKIPVNIDLCENIKNHSINKTNGFNDVIQSDKLKIIHLGKKEDRTDNQEKSGFKTDFTNVRLGNIGKETLISSTTMSETITNNNSINGEIYNKDTTKDKNGLINNINKYSNRLKTMDNGDSSVQYSISGDTDIHRVGDIGQMFSRNRKYRNYEMDESETETIVDLWLECVSESQTQSTQTTTTDS